jgi:hypothetical protein
VLLKFPTKGAQLNLKMCGREAAAINAAILSTDTPAWEKRRANNLLLLNTEKSKDFKAFL